LNFTHKIVAPTYHWLSGLCSTHLPLTQWFHDFQSPVESKIGSQISLGKELVPLNGFVVLVSLSSPAFLALVIPSKLSVRGIVIGGVMFNGLVFQVNESYATA